MRCAIAGRKRERDACRAYLYAFRFGAVMRPKRRSESRRFSNSAASSIYMSFRAEENQGLMFKCLLFSSDRPHFPLHLLLS